MSHFVPDEANFRTLKDAVFVISGGSTGIGAATTRILAGHGAKVVVGDINDTAGSALGEENGQITYVRCDVTKYGDICRLFEAAHSKHGRVDHALSAAGILERGNWFDPNLTIESVRDNSGDLGVLEVNVVGTLHFARVAAVYLRQGYQDGQDKSLTLISSVNAFRESPGLFIYQTSKHAIQGILRSSRKTLWDRDHIRVNAVCPGVTDTPMAAHIASAFREAGLWTQSAQSVAKLIIGIQSKTSLVGKAFYIEGGESWEIEDSFYETQPQWLGEEGTKRLRKNAEAVQRGALIVK